MDAVQAMDSIGGTRTDGIDHLLSQPRICLAGTLCTSLFGINIWWKYADTPVGRTIALFVFKPLIATPLWALLLALTEQPTSRLLLLPGVILTLLLVVLRYDALRSAPQIAGIVLVGDSLRWILTHLITNPSDEVDAFLSSLFINSEMLIVIPGAWTSGYAFVCYRLAKRYAASVTHPHDQAQHEAG